MNFLKAIKDRESINETLMPMLFGKNLENNSYWYGIDYDLPRLARDVLLFYFGLTQAYCFAIAQHKNKILTETGIPKDITNPIFKMWDVDDEDGFSSNGDLFSYFLIASECDDANLFTPKTHDLIKAIRDAYEPVAAKNSRVMLKTLSRELFLDFLDSLPLLKNTVFSVQTMKLEMTVLEGKLSIKSSPFISFLSFENGPVGVAVDWVTPNCYILYAISKGSTNNELMFDSMRLDEEGTESDKRRLSRKVQSNESLMLLCNAANVNTKWYSDYGCDLNFLNKMVDATEKVIFHCCQITSKKYQKDVNIKETILSIFKNTDLYEIVTRYPVIKVSDLNGILFKIFLTQGLFKTVSCIIYNPISINKTSYELFDLYLKVLAESGVIDEQKAEEYKKLCSDRIDIAVQKLAHIVSKKSEIYKRRTLEIRAEWKTFFVLQAAGIKSENLFADVETILSIDDYYDMIENDDSTIESDLKQLLSTMCVFYEALLENGYPFDEEKYFADAEKIAPKYFSPNYTLSALFDAFRDIIIRSEKSSQFEDLIGRKGIGLNAAEYLDYCKNNIFSTMDNPKSEPHPFEGTNGYTIFASYAHEDVNVVKPIVERWRKMGMKVFFDERDIRDGQDWKKRAESAIERNECKLVVAFFSKKSVCKEAVAWEIKHADMWRARKYPEDSYKREMFLIPINLEIEPIDTYLSETVHMADDSKSREQAQIIENHIKGSTVFIDYTNLSAEELDKKMLSNYETLAGDDVRVVAPYLFDDFKLAVANFYAFLKFGSTSSMGAEDIDRYFNNEESDFSRCIFPIVTSVEETRIKRDNIAIVGYELIRGKGRKKSRLSHILTSRTLEIYDYYCIPKYRNSGELKDWMIDPLMIRCDRFIEILTKPREKKNV